MSRYDDDSDLEMLARTIRSTGIDPKIYPEVREMAAKGKRHRPNRERRFAYSIQVEVTLPKLKFLENGNDGD